MKNFQFSKMITAVLFAAVLAIVTTSVWGISLFISVPLFITGALLPLKEAGSLALNATNNMSARAAFDHARHMFAVSMLDKFNGNMAQARAWANSLKLSQNEIRCEVAVNITSQNFIFGVTNVDVNSNNFIFNTEKRLNQQDSLCVSEYGLFVRKAATVTSTTENLLTYGNSNVFAVAGEATSINGTFYANGQFQITVNNDVILPARGIFNHLYVPQTQLTAVVSSATVAAPLDQIRGAEDGFITCEPNIVLIGSKRYVPQVVLQSNFTASEVAPATIRLVWVARGILAQNSTIIN
jgi:hypothetical protein